MDYKEIIEKTVILLKENNIQNVEDSWKDALPIIEKRFLKACDVDGDLEMEDFVLDIEAELKNA